MFTIFEKDFMGIKVHKLSLFILIDRYSQTKVGLCSGLTSLDSPAVGLVTVAILLVLGC